MKFWGPRAELNHRHKDFQTPKIVGRDSGAQFPAITPALAALQVGCVLDCELTIRDVHGWPDWRVLGPRTAMRQPFYPAGDEGAAGRDVRLRHLVA